MLFRVLSFRTPPGECGMAIGQRNRIPGEGRELVHNEYDPEAAR